MSGLSTTLVLKDVQIGEKNALWIGVKRGWLVVLVI